MAAGSNEKPADGRQVRWNRHNQERRDAILEAAVAAIEARPPGAEVPVQLIATAAGLSRTVLYRHFDDRADLDRAVQGRIFLLIRDAMAPAMSFEGTPLQIVRRIVAAYVEWAAAHPALHRFADQQPQGVGGEAADQAINQLAKQVEGLIVLGVQVLGVETDDNLAAATEPLVFGLIGAAFAAVRRWLARPKLAPPVDAFVDLLTEVIWAQLSGMASARGVVLDPDVPVEDLVR